MSTPNIGWLYYKDYLHINGDPFFEIILFSKSLVIKAKTVKLKQNIKLTKIIRLLIKLSFKLVVSEFFFDYQGLTSFGKHTYTTHIPITNM